MQMLIGIGVVIIGYILGSIPFGLLIVKMQNRQGYSQGGKRADRRDKCGASGRLWSGFADSHLSIS